VLRQRAPGRGHGRPTPFAAAGQTSSRGVGKLAKAGREILGQRLHKQSESVSPLDDNNSIQSTAGWADGEAELGREVDMASKQANGRAWGAGSPGLPGAVLLVAVAALGVGPAAAQDIHWRHDYDAARREAARTGRPLVVDFGTRTCFWCRRLDATTFRDAAVAEVMNRCFIPLKIDAERQAALADALGVEGYPTLVLADPDGRILDRLSGYVEAAAFLRRLHSALTAGRAPAREPDAVPSAADSRLGALYLTLADAWLEEGEQKQAVLCLQRAVAASPGTAQAQAAQMRLTQIRRQQ